MPGPEQAAERQRQLQRQREREVQRQRSRELQHQRQQLLRLAVANSHTRWFHEVLQRPDVDRMFDRWCREYEGFEEFMRQIFTGDLD